MSKAISAGGTPLAYQVLQGQDISAVLSGGAGCDVFKVEARHLTGHQREAIVTEGAGGNAWRMTSDEGLHLNGTDLAPFPFGYFNAGLQGDLMHRIRDAAAIRGVTVDRLEVALENEYWLTGSFALGTGEGHAEPSRITVTIGSTATRATVSEMVAMGVAMSPAMALLCTPLASTFALYINGRRRAVSGAAESRAADAQDPFVVYPVAPQPLGGSRVRADLIEKSAQREEGVPPIAPVGTTTRIVRNVSGRGRLTGTRGWTAIDAWLRLPGMSHFLFRTDESGSGEGPSGLALLSAGIAFCYMTQLARYVESMHLPVDGMRLVQFNPYTLVADATHTSLHGAAGAVDTHLFLNGDAPAEIHVDLLRMAARTCYLHATAAAVLPPEISIVHNGFALA